MARSLGVGMKTRSVPGSEGLVLMVFFGHNGLRHAKQFVGFRGIHAGESCIPNLVIAVSPAVSAPEPITTITREAFDPVASAKLSVMMELKVRKLDATASSGFSLLQQDFQRYPGVSLARFFLTAHTSCIIQVIYEPGSKHSHNNGGLLSHT
jgi:hypothetical protein